jgi:hypothetical protein
VNPEERRALRAGIDKARRQRDAEMTERAHWMSEKTRMENARQEARPKSAASEDSRLRRS